MQHQRSATAATLPRRMVRRALEKAASMSDKKDITLTINGSRSSRRQRRRAQDARRCDPGRLRTRRAHIWAANTASAAPVRFMVDDGAPVRSCLMFGVQADGAEIRTVEGLAKGDEYCTRCSSAFTEHHALQCGYCTPGFLMLATGVLEARTGHQRRRSA